MKIDLNTGEIWDLLQEGSSNQKEFVNSLYYSEFEEFIDFLQIEFPEIDLIGYLNGGVLFAEEDPEEEYIIWGNDRIGIVLI